ncbi:HalOD1 output domain-containing protein [Natronolimnohabitans sp. A-GB9]|uniref:HalOD1 output domain-containing protein n=1 Tax=Natronolimnohabitans sp. A-GB9 TaxID=3069757 RepID=UPI0027B8340E|nr:HalOD1 output domain-containing protein [Natronolimnohabitans sp. A-GB9]MDQ2051827.1 HalOD1 output domain-containing protein [Natronolimnohabitans sp. A-GB9]
MSGTTLDYHNDSPSLSVIEALADELETDPVELEPLYHFVDPEALDQLFQEGTHGDVRVEFVYGDHTVAVQGDGTVVVDETVHERQ